jgi:GT2 family glycosyltransferase
MSVESSIVIVNYNGGSKLERCVESVFRSTRNFELIVVDNGSNDESDSLIAQRFPKVNVVKNRENLGFAKASNIGIRRAIARWIVLLNPDTRVTSSWLDNLLKSADSANAIGIVTPKLLRPDGQTIDSTGLLFDFKTGRSRDRGSGEVDMGQYDHQEQVPSCCFACAAIRREVFEGTGLLDEKMVLYFEDLDYCIRARVAGWNVLYNPNSVVFHERGGVTPRSATRAQKWAVAYRLRIMMKCYGTKNAIKFGVLRIIRDLVSSLAGVKNGDPEYFFGYLRSPLWNLLNLPVHEREVVQSTRKVSDEALFALTVSNPLLGPSNS